METHFLWSRHAGEPSFLSPRYNSLKIIIIINTNADGRCWGILELPNLASSTEKRFCSNSAGGRLEMEREARMNPLARARLQGCECPRRAPVRRRGLEPSLRRRSGRGAGHGPHPWGSSPFPAPSPGRPVYRAPCPPRTLSSVLPAPRWLRRCHELRTNLQAESPVARPPG